VKLEVKQGTFNYREQEPLLRDVTFSLDQKQILSILGPNGVGKTTLIKCIMGLCKWVRGEALFNGSPLVSIEKVSGISFVPQAHRTAFDFTVEQMISLGCARDIPLFGSPRIQTNLQVEQTMETVGISHLKKRLCSQLSGGQLQLVYIARALVGNPELMIMDEPESHLDFKNQFMILHLIEKLNQEQEMSFIINTHYPDHALRISHKALFLGESSYAFGDASDMISEQNVKLYFEVPSKIFQVPGITRPAQAFVVID
jgi:iron complex transport system ATP-binding protein